jgi:hypothetical protein
MKGPAVDLDHELLLAPQEVDLPAGDHHVRFRHGEARLSDEREHEPLRPGSGEPGFDAGRLAECCRSTVSGVTAELLIDGREG